MAKTVTASTQPTFDRVLVGLKESEDMLGTNQDNRNVRPRRVNNYARDMLNGDWMEIGDTVRFDKNGDMIDGQHRLLALRQACTEGVELEDETILGPNPDLKIWFTVVRGLDRKAQEVMDTGAARSLADALHWRKETNTMRLASTLRIVDAWEKGYRRNIANHQLSTQSNLLARFDTDPDGFRSLVDQVSREYPKIPLQPSVLALVHYLFENISVDDADHFFAALLDGQNLAKGNPIYELRERLRDLSEEEGTKGPAYVLALTIKAWNAYRLKEKIQLLGFKMGGKHPEKFPVPM